MHLVIPFAAPLAPAGRQALAALALPGLQRALACSEPAGQDLADETSLSPPHERVQARALGWPLVDGRLPWAALWAAAAGIDVGTLGWARLTPAHWHLGTDQVSLLDPALLALDEAGSRALLDAVEGLFTSEGFVLAFGDAQRWFLGHPSLAGLATASLDRVIGRNVDPWLTGGPPVRLIRRLQNEVQMLLHEHPINAERAARGLLSVNSFWLDGCGVALPSPAAAPALHIDDRLRAPALAEDWPAWVAAWQALDQGPLADWRERAAAGQPLQLSLCGERGAATFVTGPAGPQGRWRRGWRRLRSLARPPRPADWLEVL